MDRHDWATDLEKNSISGKASSRPPGAQKKASMPLREYPMTHMVEPYAEVDLEALPNIGDEGQHKVDASERIVAEDNDKELGKRRRRELRSIPLSKMEFYDRLTASGIRHLYGRAGTPQEPKSYKIELSTLQRMVIHDTQRKLVLLVRQIVRQHRVNSITLKRAQTLLSQYTIAVRNYDYMTEKLDLAKQSGERDPYSITTEDALSLYLMKDALLVPETPPVHAQNYHCYKQRMNILPGASRTAHNQNAGLKQMWRRVWMGLCGGLALIAPMLLMVLHKDEATTLSTVSIATMLFALGLAFFGEGLKGQEVLASVAAYAAVLVVFVGTSS